MSGFLLMMDRDVDEVMGLLRVEKDTERYSQVEGDLYEATLEAIAGGWPNPAQLAQRALEAKRIREQRGSWWKSLVPRPRRRA